MSLDPGGFLAAVDLLPLRGIRFSPSFRRSHRPRIEGGFARRRPPTGGSAPPFCPSPIRFRSSPILTQGSQNVSSAVTWALAYHIHLLFRVSTGTEIPDLHLISEIAFLSTESSTNAHHISQRVAASFGAPTDVHLSTGDTASSK